MHLGEISQVIYRPVTYGAVPIPTYVLLLGLLAACLLPDPEKVEPGGGWQPVHLAR